METFVFILLIQFATGDMQRMKSTESYTTLESCNEAAADISKSLVKQAADITGIPTRGFYKCIKEGYST